MRKTKQCVTTHFLKRDIAFAFSIIYRRRGSKRRKHALEACQRKQEQAGPTKEYQLHGEVVRLDPQHKIAVIKGEKIEGWMEAMTMEYPVKAPAEFEKLKPGLKIQATVFQRPSSLDYWIGNIQVVQGDR